MLARPIESRSCSWVSSKPGPGLGPACGMLYFIGANQRCSPIPADRFLEHLGGHRRPDGQVPLRRLMLALEALQRDVVLVYFGSVGDEEASR